MRLDNALPRDGWIVVIRNTVLITLASSILSVVLAEAIMLTISKGLDIQGAIASFVLPLLLATPVMFFMMLRNEQLKRANGRLRTMAMTDGLTGCLNRSAFAQRVDEALCEQGGTLLVIDADHFKSINDRFGHETGDRALQFLGDTLRALQPVDGIVGRLGGEEFGMLFADRGEAVAERMADAIRTAVQALELVPQDGMRLSVSIGGASARKGSSFAEAFRIADARLYAAKAAGRNRSVIQTLAA